MKHFLFSSKRTVCFLVAITSATLPFVALGQKRISIATGPTSGVYFPLGGAVAKVLSAHVPGITADYEATSASADNIRQIAADKADIAFTQADTAWDGYKGFGTFQQRQPIRTIAVLYPNNLHVVTLMNSGITKVTDLRGKRVSTGPAKSGTEIWGERLLMASGIDPNKDITRQSLGPSESALALKEGKLDAFIWSGGAPTKAISDLAKEPGMSIRLLNTALMVTSMLRKYGPVYTDGEIPANTYQGVTMPVKVAQVWNLLVVKDTTDEKVVYDLVKALFEHKDELIAGHAEARNILLTNQGFGRSPIKFHIGAKTYMNEKGVRVY